MKRVFLRLIVFSILLSPGMQAQWVKTGFSGNRVQSIAAKDFLLYALSEKSFYSSGDNGTTWDSLSSFTGIGPQHILFLNDTLFVYANWAVVADGSPMKDSPCIFRSDDGGHTWKTILSSFMGAGSMTISGRTIFCTVDPIHLLKSTDYGTSWDTLSYNLPSSSGQIDNLFSFNKKLYAAQYKDRMYRSSDGGLNWTDISGSLQLPGYPFMFSNSKYFFVASDSILYRSSDDGETWEKLMIPLIPKISVYCAAATDTVIFLSGTDRKNFTAKVYAGTISSNRWRDISAGLPEGTNFFPTDLTVMDNWLYLAGSRELWKYSLSHLLAVEDNPAAVTTFSLSQNYPNPFNPMTTIRYSIPGYSFVELKIFDMLGREVQSLVNNEQSAGDHSVKFNGSSLPSGMYVYSIHAGEFMDSKKLLLIK